MCNSITRRSGDADWRNDHFNEHSYDVDSRKRVLERKTAQLCAQAQRALGRVIQNELSDADLCDLAVLEVHPHPDAGRLLVVLSAPQGCELERTQRALQRACARLRQALGYAISRKRVPLLSFAVICDGGEADE